MCDGNVFEFTCQTDRTPAQLDLFVNNVTADPNNITTHITSNSTTLVLKVRAVPINGDEIINIMCILWTPFTIKSANLTIKGTVNH